MSATSNKTTAANTPRAISAEDKSPSFDLMSRGWVPASNGTTVALSWWSLVQQAEPEDPHLIFASEPDGSLHVETTFSVGRLSR